MTGHIVPVPVL